MLRDLSRPFLAVVPAKVILVALTLLQPSLIQRSIEWFSEPKSENSNNIGYGLIGAYGIVYIGIAVCCLPFPLALHLTN